MECHVGTSGWMYGWNPDGLEWYIKETSLDSIELNMSFYRFPRLRHVERWAEVGRGLRWSVKVNRLITHNYKFVEKSYGSWHRFQDLFKPLDRYIAFYLFQLPPRMGPSLKTVAKLRNFIGESDLAERFALEWRNVDWFTGRWVRWCERQGITLVSVDSPEHPRTVFNTSGATYLRVHGREVWYGYEYSDDELEDMANYLIEVKPLRIYVFFNNNHGMLRNGATMRKILEKKTKAEVNDEGDRGHTHRRSHRPLTR